MANNVSKGKTTRKISASQKETAEILNDAELMKELAASIKESRKGKTIPWDKAKIQA